MKKSLLGKSVLALLLFAPLVHCSAADDSAPLPAPPNTENAQATAKVGEIAKPA